MSPTITTLSGALKSILPASHIPIPAFKKNLSPSARVKVAEYGNPLKLYEQGAKSLQALRDLGGPLTAPVAGLFSPRAQAFLKGQKDQLQPIHDAQVLYQGAGDGCFASRQRVLEMGDRLLALYNEVDFDDEVLRSVLENGLGDALLGIIKDPEVDLASVSDVSVYFFVLSEEDTLTSDDKKEILTSLANRQIHEDSLSHAITVVSLLVEYSEDLGDKVAEKALDQLAQWAPLASDPNHQVRIRNLLDSFNPENSGLSWEQLDEYTTPVELALPQEQQS